MVALRAGRQSALLVSAILALAASGATASNLTAQQALGKKLFNDTALSHGGNQACASCHSAQAAFTDPNKLHATSAGSNPTLFGARNSPSAMYMAFSPTFGFDAAQGLYIGGEFDDGRAATLEDQAKAPFLNPIEMGNADRAEVINHLMSSPTSTDFIAVFGPGAFGDIDTAYNNVAVAIADFERSSELSPFTSKFDYVNKGRATFTVQESRGLSLFNDPMKGNCAACHISSASENGTPALFTDFTYDNIGSPKNYQNDFLNNPSQFNPDGVNFSDRGLGAIVGDASLDGAFKVTTLRNITLTGPYGHNGWFTSLEQVIDFYSSRDLKPVCMDPTVTAVQADAQGCWPVAEFGATMNVDELGALGLNNGERADIAAFLGTLNDGYQVDSVPEPAAWAMMILGFLGVGGLIRRRRAKAAA